MSNVEIRTDRGDTYHVDSHNLEDCGKYYKYRHGWFQETDIDKNHIVSIHRSTTFIG